jgi:xylulokinase
MGVTLAAGGSLRWLRDLLWSAEKTEAEQSGAEVYDLMTETAGRVPAGSEGLVFLPYLSGERTPHPDPDARGVFFGLSLRHARPHLTRAVIEGVTFSLRECLDLLGYVKIKFDRVRISGGGARSSLWRQIMADVFGVEVVEVNIAQGAAFGAALLAGVGTAVFSDAADACSKTIHETTITRPGPDRPLYQKLYERYQGLYPVLKGEFEQLAKFIEKR